MQAQQDVSLQLLLQPIYVQYPILMGRRTICRRILALMAFLSTLSDTFAA